MTIDEVVTAFLGLAGWLSSADVRSFCPSLRFEFTRIHERRRLDAILSSGIRGATGFTRRDGPKHRLGMGP